MREKVVKVALNDPTFLEKLFAKVGVTACDDPLERLLLDESVKHCRAIDDAGLQQSSSFRAVRLGRGLAALLISDSGELLSKKLHRALEILQQNRYSLGPKRYLDDLGRDHVLSILTRLKQEPELRTALMRISRPHASVAAQKLIKDTLLLPPNQAVTDSDARRAVLSALLTPLRQNVGSCFATAPAILIQTQSPLQCVQDLGQLLGTGILKRVFEGVEYAVPLSISGGMADLFRSTYSTSLGKKPLKTLAAGPGILAGFEAAGVMGPKLNQKQKQQMALTLLEKSDLKQMASESFFAVNADEIFRTVLMKAHRVTQEDLEQFELRPSPILSGIAMPIIPAKRGKSSACQKYKKSYEAATTAFIAMTDNALLKAWEFTLASLSETKAEFAKWNLYSSLGLNAEEADGIGSCFYALLQSKIDETNEEIQEQQGRYDHLFAAVKSLEGRFASADTESKMNWIQAEYQTRKREINQVLALRDEAYEKGQRLHALFPFLLKFYAEKFKDYFQEVYDAKMRDVEVSIYDDTPAGFRLLYKHGRSNPSLWTLIYNAKEFTQSLASFFIATEVELSQCPETKGLERELTGLVTAAITLVKRDEFLEASFYRLAKAYNEPIIKNPLQNIERVKRKPWVYVSGGTMTTLVQTYFGNPSKPKEASRWVESPRELLAFFIDTVKELPLSVQKKVQQKDNALLAFSPTHAFLLKPGWQSFRRGWESDLYTYTWIRNTFESTGKKFLDSIRLDARMMERLRDLIAQFIPMGYRSLFKNTLSSFAYSMTPARFREHVIKTLSHEKWVRQAHALPLLLEEVDSVLYGSLPLFPEHQLKEKLSILFGAIEEIDEPLLKELMAHFESYQDSLMRYTLVTASNLRDIAKALLMLALKKTKSASAWHRKIHEAMQKEEMAYPAPLIFADTNWVDNVFGFVVGPGSEGLELWRFDPSGSCGKPLHIWKGYVDGSSKLPWGVFNAPREYS